jgi:hypothetical protein
MEHIIQLPDYPPGFDESVLDEQETAVWDKFGEPVEREVTKDDLESWYVPINTNHQL